MASTDSGVEEAAEAVIISGARKGELIRIPTRELEVTPAEAALLDDLAAGAGRVAEGARAAAEEAEALLQELRQARAK